MDRRDNETLKGLDLLIALDQHRHLGRAAAAMGLSQPAASAALQRLREAHVDPLFLRERQGMQPTPRAVSLVAAARQISAILEQEVRSARRWSAREDSGAFTLALSDAGEMVLLPKILRAVRRAAPLSSFTSVSPTPELLGRGLEEGSIDLAVGYFPQLRPKLYLNQGLLRHSYACLVRSGHPVARKSLTLKQFAALDHLAVRVESRSQEVVEQFFAKRSLERRIALRTPHFATVPALIADSDLIVTLPYALAHYFVQHDDRLRLVSLQTPLPSITLCMYWHRRFHHDERNLWLRGQIAQTYPLESMSE